MPEGVCLDEDSQFLAIYEDLHQIILRLYDKYPAAKENSPQADRLAEIKDRIEIERRIIDELSLPCRLIVEHLSMFKGKPDYTLGFKSGRVDVSRSTLIDLRVGQWGNVYLAVGNVELHWRDEDYLYHFYPDKIVLQSKDLSRSEIKIFFSLSFNCSRVLERFKEARDHPQVAYWHFDLDQDQQQECTVL